MVKRMLILWSSWLLVLCSRTPLEAQVYLKLEPMNVQIENRNFNIQEVVDVRLDKTRIGIIPYGPLQQAELAMLPMGLANYLKTYLNESLPTVSQTYPILLRVDRLGIATEREGESIAKLDADFTFFLIGERGYQQIFSQQHRLVSKGQTVKGRHEALIRSALHTSITALSESGWEKIVASLPVRTYQEIAETYFPPILTVENPTAGVYRSFEEFRNNAPFIANFHWKGDNKLNRTAYFTGENGEENKVTTKDLFWGFSDGENIYLLEGTHYVELRRSGRGVHYLGSNKSLAWKRAAKWGVAAGIIGGGLAGASTGKTGLYIIDMETGVHLYAK
jgi:hypothetical protein